RVAVACVALQTDVAEPDEIAVEGHLPAVRCFETVSDRRARLGGYVDAARRGTRVSRQAGGDRRGRGDAEPKGDAHPSKASFDADARDGDGTDLRTAYRLFVQRRVQKFGDERHPLRAAELPALLDAKVDPAKRRITRQVRRTHRRRRARRRLAKRW